jgi:3-hydroxyanthranilate 3,4-dioxygenase
MNLQSQSIPILPWIHDNKHFFKPPVGNKMIYPQGDFIIMVVAGPNERKDYHVNGGEEFFFQLEGTIELKLQTPQGPQTVTIAPGEIYLLPAHTPHSPQRPKDSFGLVIERKRLENEWDTFQWYCDHCQQMIFSAKLKLKNIVDDLPEIFKSYGVFKSEHNNQCPQCQGQIE